MSNKGYSSTHPYRVAVTWESFTRFSPKIDTLAALAPESPGTRNGVAFKFTELGLAAVTAGTPPCRKSSFRSLTRVEVSKVRHC
jgi:hypothetical protein